MGAFDTLPAHDPEATADLAAALEQDPDDWRLAHVTAHLAAERCGLLATEAKATRLTLASARRIGMAHPRGVPERAARRHPPAQRALASREVDGGQDREQQPARPTPERG